MNDCVVWDKSLNRDGYGNQFFRGVMTLAHRVAWIKAYGEIPDGTRIVHRCGNKACVNVAHLAERRTRRTNGKRTPTYITWTLMKQRCLNPAAPDYARYGGRGISICARWHNYDCFLADMGPRPHGTTLDRIDVDGGYRPENCRWATQEQQRGNTRRSVYLFVDGQKMCAAHAARRLGIKYATLKDRIRRGLPMHKILSAVIRSKP